MWLYGRGPTAAKAGLLDDYVFVAMEGGLTRSEETLIADGKDEEVRRFRLAFQPTVAETAKRAVAHTIRSRSRRGVVAFGDERDRSPDREGAGLRGIDAP
jgi:hypothetical protein